MTVGDIDETMTQSTTTCVKALKATKRFDANWTRLVQRRNRLTINQL